VCLCVCVCVRERGRVRVSECVCVFVSVRTLQQHMYIMFTSPLSFLCLMECARLFEAHIIV